MTEPRLIDFAKEARELKNALSENAYPAQDGTADIDNHAIPLIEVTLRHIAERAVAIANRSTTGDDDY